jgi:hypothetical protein
MSAWRKLGFAHHFPKDEEGDNSFEAGLPEFSLYNLPKWGKCNKRPQNI